MQKIFVLGGSGFIGSNLMKFLKSKFKNTVYSVGRTDCDIYVDIVDASNELINSSSKGDVVVFLSAISSPDVCSKKPELAYKVNVTATVELINKLTVKGVKVVFSSTDTVFGNSRDIVNDNSLLAPFGEYAKMKAKVEELVLKNDLVKTIRFSYVIGFDDKYSTLLSEMANNNQVLEVFDGFERSAVALDDVLEGVYQLINRWDHFTERVINFSGPNLISRLEITRLYFEYVNKDLKFKITDAPTGFWDARAKTINMTSSIFPQLLGKPPMSIKLKFEKWSKL